MQFINEQDAATRERFIQRLEFRATDPTFTAYAMERRSQAAARESFRVTGAANDRKRTLLAGEF